MNRRAKQYLLVFAACVGVTVWGLASAPPPRPAPASPPHRYGAFAPGSWVLIDETLRRAEPLESNERIEIVARTGDAVRVRTETTITGKPPTSVDQIIGLRDELTAVEGADRVGTETLTIDGRRFDCAILRRGSFQFWLSPAIPWPVKSIDRDLANTSTEISLTRASDRVQIPGRVIECVVFEELHRAGGQIVRRSTVWRTAEIPGHEARREDSFTMNGEPASLTRVVVKFEVK